MKVVEGTADGAVSPRMGNGSAGEGAGNGNAKEKLMTINTMARKWGWGRTLCPPQLPRGDENNVQSRRVGREGDALLPNHLEPGRGVEYFIIFLLLSANELESIEG